MKIFPKVAQVDVSWCGRTITIVQSDAGGSQSVEIPAAYVTVLIDALRDVAREARIAEYKAPGEH